MIYTLTLNPAVDYYMETAGELKQNNVNRGKNERFKAAGKGLNASRDLSIMSIPSYAVAVLAGFTGAFIQDTFKDYPYIRLVPVKAHGNNRVNLKMFSEGELTEVNGEGPYADEFIRNDILRAFEETSKDDTVLICGSLIRGFNAMLVKELCEELHERGTTVVLDSVQLSLQQLCDCRPQLIRLTEKELGALLNMDVSTENLKEALEKIREAGLPNILLTIDSNDAALMLGDQMYCLSQPKSRPVNKVGAGDALLAAYIGKRTQGVGPADALRWAGAMANAVASTMDETTLDEVMNRFDETRVISID
ncbi:MAG: PfkB family carbohydrate kinase [Erysipelotrichaceae bacterium]|nr:PfkB family carbohydrate kinase [Erysipelotrichaceae bacterium]